MAASIGMSRMEISKSSVGDHQLMSATAKNPQSTNPKDASFHHFPTSVCVSAESAATLGESCKLQESINTAAYMCLSKFSFLGNE